MLNNEVFGWLWILVGFISGMIIGMKFHHEEWMGGYGSHRRRLIRLGHISFIGLGILNIFFAHSFPNIHLDASWLVFNSWLWIIGAISMPLCCGLLAWRKETHLAFCFPVVSLIMANLLTVIGLVRS